MSTSVPSKPTSTVEFLSRLADLHTRSHMHSSRTRRACVAIILRLHHPSDSPYVTLRPCKPKVKKPRPPKKPTVPSASATLTSAAPHTIINAAITPPPPPRPVPVPIEPDVMTKMPSSITPERSSAIRAAIANLSNQPWAAESHLEMIYMQRAQNPNDRWSGQMSFPGGRQDKGEKDEDTAVREVNEEIGWKLRDQSKFIELGQLDDKPMDGLKNVKPLAVGIFGGKDSKEEREHIRRLISDDDNGCLYVFFSVFLQICRESPPLILEPSEVSAVLFVPLSYFQSLRSSHDFGRIYHPLMLQILARAPSAGSTTSKSPPPSFDLKLIGWPHKREGRPMTRAGSEQLSPEQQQALDRMEEQQGHISELDEQPFTDNNFLATFRARIQHFAHELPLPSLPALPPLSRPLNLQFLPRIEQLASLRFPALSLPGVWVDSEGRGGTSTGDDIRTKEWSLMRLDETPKTVEVKLPPEQLVIHGAAAHEQAPSTIVMPSAPIVCPPPFILWGMTLEKSFELLYFLGWTFGYNFLARGSDWRRKQYRFWTGVGEARWRLESRLGANVRQDDTPHVHVEPRENPAVTAAPLVVSAFAPSTIASPPPIASSHLQPSSYSTPVLLARLKQRASDAWTKQKEKIRSRL